MPEEELACKAPQDRERGTLRERSCMKRQKWTGKLKDKRGESKESRINKGEVVRDPGPEKLRKTQEVKKEGGGGPCSVPTQEKPTMAMGPRKPPTRSGHSSLLLP